VIRAKYIAFQVQSKPSQSSHIGNAIKGAIGSGSTILTVQGSNYYYSLWSTSDASFSGLWSLVVYPSLQLSIIGGALAALVSKTHELYLNSQDPLREFRSFQDESKPRMVAKLDVEKTKEPEDSSPQEDSPAKITTKEPDQPVAIKPKDPLAALRIQVALDREHLRPEKHSSTVSSAPVSPEVVSRVVSEQEEVLPQPVVMPSDQEPKHKSQPVDAKTFLLELREVTRKLATLPEATDDVAYARYVKEEGLPYFLPGNPVQVSFPTPERDESSQTPKLRNIIRPKKRSTLRINPWIKAAS
jgi:hypothetical protein